MVKRKVATGVIGHVESKSGLLFCANSGLSQVFRPLLVQTHDSFNQFLGKTRQSDFLEYTPLLLLNLYLSRRRLPRRKIAAACCLSIIFESEKKTTKLTQPEYSKTNFWGPYLTTLPIQQGESQLRGVSPYFSLTLYFLPFFEYYFSFDKNWPKMKIYLS